MPASDVQITFQTLIGPTGGDFTFGPEKPVVIGRAAGSDVCLLHDWVSRKHALASRHGDQWYLVDQGSKSGTLLNGVKLHAQTPAVIKPGDLVKIGPWTFRILGPGGVGGTVTTGNSLARTIDESVVGGRVERSYVDEAVLQSDRRLRLLVEFIQKLGTAQVVSSDDVAEDEAAAAAERTMAKTALESILQGSGYARGAILRRLPNAGESVEVIATARQSGEPESDFGFSRSLVSRASQGEVAILSREAGGAGGPGAAGVMHSIADMRIHSALCAPIHLGEIVEGYLYLDARGAERSVRSDAAGFCEAAAKAYGLAVSNLRRIALEVRQRALNEELTAARQAQEMILPATSGVVGGLRYAMKVRPGLFVAGDLFDVVPLDDGRVMVCIGDVVGHGIAPAMLMAIVQSQLHAQVMRYGDPARALTEVNRYACPRSTGGRFVSLWAGIFEPDGTLRFADAGHGHWIYRQAADGPWREHDSEKAGLPIGIDPETEYLTQVVKLSAGGRVMLYSDGITEQRGSEGEMFGKERLKSVAEAGASGDAVALVNQVFLSVTKHAGLATEAAMDDDATVAVVQLGASG